MKFRFLAVVVGVVLLVLIAHDVPLASHLSRVERDRLITSLERDAYVLGGQVSQIILVDNATLQGESATLLGEFANTSDATAVIVDKNGYLLASTSPSDAAGEDYTTRPEIASALLGSFKSGVRISRTLGEELIYVAVPIVFGDNVLGVVRLTYPKSTIDARVNERVRVLIFAAGVSVAIAVLSAFLLSAVLSRPLTNLRTATDRFAQGDVSTTVEEQGPIETRQLAKSFNSMALRVRNMLDHQRSFAGDAAHQLRTPLTALRLRLEQASDSMQTAPAVAQEHIKAAVNETNRLANVTEQLLRLARTEGAVLDAEPIELRTLIGDLCDEWSFLAEERKTTLRSAVTEQVQCVTNKLALCEILGDYIDNAIEHSPDGGEIVVLVQQEAHEIVVTVRDQGPGLTQEQCQHAFDRFWRGTQARRGSQGSGLGLAIAAQLAAASNMSLELRQPPTTGLAASPTPGLDAIVKIPTTA